MITGSKGQLGSDCARVLSEAHEVMAIDLDELDITILSDAERLIRQFSPNIIINCAAYTQVDNCEIEKELAWKVNVNGAENLAQSMEKHGGRLIHISTDYVFDGRKKIPRPYIEADEPNPVSFYGVTKQESEKVVRQAAKLVDMSEYKRRQAPPGVKITPRAFGRDRRLPITNSFKKW